MTDSVSGRWVTLCFNGGPLSWGSEFTAEVIVYLLSRLTKNGMVLINGKALDVQLVFTAKRY